MKLLKERIKGITMAFILSLNIFTIISSIGILFDYPGFHQYTTSFIIFYLIGAFFLLITGSIFNSLPYLISSPQNHTAPLFLLMGSHIANFLSSSQTPEEFFPTIFATFAITGILSGIIFFAIGYFKKGNFIRYIPFPIICGFLSALGYFLLGKVIKILKINLSLNKLFLLLLIMFSAWIFFRIKAVKKPWLILIFFISSLCIFHFFLFFFNISIYTAASNGWVLNFDQIPLRNIVIFPAWSLLKEVNWDLVFTQSSFILITVLISLLTHLINSMSLESSLKKDLDFNNELIANGIGNTLAGIFAGIPGYVSTTNTFLAKTLGIRWKYQGFLTSLFLLLFIFFGVNNFIYIPIFYLLGMLLNIALSLLYQWLYLTFFRLNKQDYFLVLLIFFTSCFFGFFPAFIVGIIFSVLLFSINYSQIDVVHYELSGKTIQCTKLRSLKYQKILLEHGNRLIYYKLRNYIFFGSFFNFIKRVEDLIEKNQDLTYLLLDFSLVVGMDSSAIQYFTKLKRILDNREIFLIIVNLHPKMKEELIKEISMNKNLQIFESIYQALEWYEESLLKDLGYDLNKKKILLEELSSIGFSKDKGELLIKYLEKVSVKKGDYIFRQGDISEGIYFLVSGEVSIVLHTKHHGLHTLRTFCSGNIFGEMAFYTKKPRTSSTIANTDCGLLYLSKEAYKKIEELEPQLAIAFDRVIINILVERLVFRNHQVEVLGIS